MSCSPRRIEQREVPRVRVGCTDDVVAPHSVSQAANVGFSRWRFAPQHRGQFGGAWPVALFVLICRHAPHGLAEVDLVETVHRGSRIVVAIEPGDDDSVFACECSLISYKMSSTADISRLLSSDDINWMSLLDDIRRCVLGLHHRHRIVASPNTGTRSSRTTMRRPQGFSTPISIGSPPPPPGTC